MVSDSPGGRPVSGTSIAHSARPAHQSSRVGPTVGGGGLRRRRTMAMLAARRITSVRREGSVRDWLFMCEKWRSVEIKFRRILTSPDPYAASQDNTIQIHA